MKVFTHLQGFISENLKVAKTFGSLVKLEARLAGLSIFPLLINLCSLVVLTFGLWLSTMLLLQYGLMLWFENYLLSILGVFLFNILLFGLVVKNVSLHLKRMSFAKTRASFSQQPSTDNESTTIAYPNPDNV